MSSILFNLYTRRFNKIKVYFHEKPFTGKNKETDSYRLNIVTEALFLNFELLPYWQKINLLK